MVYTRKCMKLKNHGMNQIKGDEFLCKFINPMLAPAMDNRESVFCVSDK